MAATALAWVPFLLMLCMFVAAYSLPTTTSDDDTQGEGVVGFNPEKIGLLMDATQNGIAAHMRKKEAMLALHHALVPQLVKEKRAVKEDRFIVKSRRINKRRNVAKRSAPRKGKKDSLKTKKMSKRSAHEKKQKQMLAVSKERKKKKKRASDATKKRKRATTDGLFDQPRGESTIAANEVDGYRNRNEVPVELLFKNFLDAKRDVIPQPPSQAPSINRFQGIFQKRSEIPHNFQDVAPFHAVWSELPDSELQKRSEIPNESNLEKRQTGSELPIAGNVFENISGNTPLSYLAHLEETQRQQNVKRDEIARPDQLAPGGTAGGNEEFLKKDKIMSPEEAPTDNSDPSLSKKNELQLQRMKSSEDEYHEPPVKKGTIIPFSRPVSSNSKELVKPLQKDMIMDANGPVNAPESLGPISSTPYGSPLGPESSRSMVPSSSVLETLSETPGSPMILESSSSVMQVAPSQLTQDTTPKTVKYPLQLKKMK